MTNAAQLSLFFDAVLSPAFVERDRAACIADKLQADRDLGLDRGEDFEPDFA